MSGVSLDGERVLVTGGGQGLGSSGGKVFALCSEVGDELAAPESLASCLAHCRESDPTFEALYQVKLERDDAPRARACKDTPCNNEYP